MVRMHVLTLGGTYEVNWSISRVSCRQNGAWSDNQAFVADSQLDAAFQDSQHHREFFTAQKHGNGQEGVEKA